MLANMTSVTGIVEFTDNSLLIVQREGILPDLEN